MWCAASQVCDAVVLLFVRAHERVRLCCSWVVGMSILSSCLGLLPRFPHGWWVALLYVVQSFATCRRSAIYNGASVDVASFNRTTMATCNTSDGSVVRMGYMIRMCDSRLGVRGLA